MYVCFLFVNHTTHSASIGLTEDKQLFNVAFSRDGWDGEQALILAYKRAGGSNPFGGTPPNPADRLDSGKHTSTVRVDNFDFTRTSTCRPTEVNGVKLRQDVKQRCVAKKTGQVDLTAQYSA